MKSKVVVSLTMVAIFILMASSVSAQPPRVNVMPDGIRNPPVVNTAYAWPGKSLVIWGNVHHGTSPYTYNWDFGDGSSPVSGAVTDPRYIAQPHAYATMGTKLATLIVTDANGLSDTDQVRIDVVPEDMNAKINLAIEKGLRYLYLHNYGTISWQGWGAEGLYRVGAFGMEVLAFENRGHLPTNDVDEDIYAEYVQQGLDIIFSLSYTQAIGPQPYGNPDTDGDGIGVYFYDGGPSFPRPLYEVGIAIMAIVGSMAPDRTATTGPVGVKDSTYATIVRDAVDYCAWAQNEMGAGRGGWRYTANYSSSDNSVTQWPAIGLEAAETCWGISAPDFVKNELWLWLAYSQNSNGGFGYDNGWDAGRLNVGLTGAGICELSYCNTPHSDPRIQNALNYISNNWYQGCSVTHGNFGNYYAMYAVAKACRIAVPDEIVMIGPHDWEAEYDSHLVVAQYDDGHWDGCNYGSHVLDTGFGVLILTPTVVCMRPVAVIDAPTSVPPNTPFNMDGSHSYHMDPTKMIVKWLWDFDKSNGVDWNNPDVVGSNVVNPGYPLPPAVLADTFVVSLRVGDNGDPVLTDVAEHTVIVSRTNHPPIADPNGPYAAKVGETICFDGTGSYDPDSGDYIVSYSWDINGDGFFGDCTNPVCCTSWNYVYSGYVGLVVTDSYGATSDTSTAYVTIWTSEIDVGIDSLTGIFFSSGNPMPGDTIIINAVVYCDSESDPVGSVRVRFYDGDPEISVHQINGDQMIYNMVALDVETVQVEWVVPDNSPHVIFVKVDPNGELQEYEEDNNKAFKLIEPGPGPGPVHPPEDTCVYPGTLTCIPIYLDSLPPWDVYSAQFILHYDEAVLHALYAQTNNGIAEPWGDPTYNIGVGKIAIAMAGTDPLTTTGVLVWVCFDVVAEIGDSTLLEFEGDHAILNDSTFRAKGGVIRVCPNEYEICGRVRYCLNDQPVKNAQMMISGGKDDTVNTDADGIYKFTHLPPGLDYVVRGDKDDDARGAISAFDASLVLRYTVGLLNLSPCKMIAGDVNGNCWVNAYDASLILKYVVGLIPQFPVGKDWKFIPAAFVLDTLNWCTAPDSVWYENLSENLCCEDWRGILYGDLSGNWDNVFFVAGYHPEDVLSRLIVKDIQVNPGEEFAVPIEVEDISEVYGAELSLTYDNSLLSLVKVVPAELLQGYYFEKNLTPGEIRLAMAGTSPIQGSGNLVNLTFKVLPQAQEGITTQLQVSHFCLNETSAEGSAFNISIGAGTTHPKEFSLYQNYPNPFNPETKISFAVPVACRVQIKIFNVGGQLVKTYEGDYPAGTHSISWDGTNLKGEAVGSGIYFYRMDAGNFTQQKKMVLMR